MRRWLVISCLLIVAFIGCERHEPAAAPWLELSIDSGESQRGVVVFLVDGVNPRIFQDMLAAGDLPNIEAQFVRRGFYTPMAVIDTPSLTAVNLPAMITGQLAGDHGVVGVNWFDREQLIWRDYTVVTQKNTLDDDYTGETIFEALSDRESYALFFQPHRGATMFYENLSSGPALVLGSYDTVDQLTFARLEDVADAARAVGRWPALMMLYLPAADFYGHHVSMEPTSHDVHGRIRITMVDPAYRDALRKLDERIGMTMDSFRSAGMGDELLFVLTSDHGLRQINRHFPLAQFLRDEWGVDVINTRAAESEPFEVRQAIYNAGAAQVSCSGNRYGAIQLRKPVVQDEAVTFAPWPIRPAEADLHAYPTMDGGTIDLPASLAARPEVAAAVWQSDAGEVLIQTARGMAALCPHANGLVHYELRAGDDPLGWAGQVDEALLAGQPADVDRWLAETAGLAFADAPRQLPAYFRARRAGDIVVFAADDWDFAGRYHAGHGGIHAEELHVPLLVRGPGIAPGSTLPVVRRDVVVPTALTYLDRGEAMVLSIPSLQDLLAAAREQNCSQSLDTDSPSVYDEVSPQDAGGNE